MIIKLLDDRLPIELSDKIYYMLHRSIMKDISIIINYKIVFVLVGNKLSFLISASKHCNFAPNTI